MDIDAARVLAGDLLRRHPELSDWRVTFSRRSRRTLGLCRHRHKVIQLSAPFVRLNDEADVLDVILHEVAHALVGPGKGHGEAWQAMARRVGANPERVNLTATVPPGDWVATCPSCGRTFDRCRRPRRRYWCRPCGPEKGPLTFTRRS